MKNSKKTSAHTSLTKGSKSSATDTKPSSEIVNKNAIQTKFTTPNGQTIEIDYRKDSNYGWGTFDLTEGDDTCSGTIRQYRNDEQAEYIVEFDSRDDEATSQRIAMTAFSSRSDSDDEERMWDFIIEHRPIDEARVIDWKDERNRTALITYCTELEKAWDEIYDDGSKQERAMMRMHQSILTLLGLPQLSADDLLTDIKNGKI